MKAILRSLYNNGVENPFFELIDDFFQRQITLQAQTIVLSTTKDLPGISIQNAAFDEDDVLTTTDNIVDYEKEVDGEELKTRFYLLGVALSVENIETLIKGFIVQILKLKFEGNSSFEDFKSTHRTNAERLNFLKKYSIHVREFYKKENVSTYHKTFIVCEQIRHITIHANQVIKEKDKSIITLPLFKEYFSLASHPKGERIILNAHKAEIIIERLTSLGLILFKALCKEHKISLSTDDRRI